jgi:ribosomal protein S12
MPSRALTRRSSLLLPFLLAACGGHKERLYQPLHYGYLMPLRLNVAAIQVEQRFVPSGVTPDVSQLDPAPPIQALRSMAEDRLQAFGSSGQAVFVIQDASLVRQHDSIIGSMAVELDIYPSPNVRAAYAQARVSRTYSGDLDDLPSVLYDITKNMMDTMNVEFEYQLRHSLGGWLLPEGAPQAPVQQQPLMQQSLPPPEPVRQP